MSSNRFRYEGLEELKRDLAKLPEDLRAEGSVIIVDEGVAATDEVRAAYNKHRRSGDLADHVKLEEIKGTGRFFAGVRIRNTSKLASIFENGTEARHTKFGAFRGKMPPGHIFVPVILKHRKIMFDKLRDLIKRKGMQVQG